MRISVFITHVLVMATGKIRNDIRTTKDEDGSLNYSIGSKPIPICWHLRYDIWILNDNECAL